MIAGIPAETHSGELRVALIPDSLPSLSKAGIDFLVEPGAGIPAGFPDEAYQQKGASLAASRTELFAQADMILQVRTYGANPDAGRQDLQHLRAEQVVIGMCEPLSAVREIRELAATGVTLLALELMPRITRAQSMDVLSAMATLAGYKAVLMAATELPRIFPLMMTAAGTLTPAKVLVVGAGVAGLQAIATSRRLGAVVQAYDLRPAVREQVESLGARFVDLGLDAADSEDAGGYAVAQHEEFYQRQRAALGEVVAESDVVITTAAVPGKPAPLLITAETVSRMAQGSVVVDLAAERGGNCESTRPNERIIHHGVIVQGPTNLPSTIPNHASQMFAHNLSTFVQHLLKEGELTLDDEDEITSGTLVARGGKIVHPLITQLAEEE